MDIAVHGGLDAGVAQELLQHLGLHSALDGAGGVGVPQGVHTEPFDPRLVAQLAQVGVIGAVLRQARRFDAAILDVLQGTSTQYGGISPAVGAA